MRIVEVSGLWLAPDSPIEGRAEAFSATCARSREAEGASGCAGIEPHGGAVDLDVERRAADLEQAVFNRRRRAAQQGR